MRCDGHAVEVRLYAEDAEHGFLPATGRIERLRWPSGEGIRVDAGVAEGDEVGGPVRPDARQDHRPRRRPRRRPGPADARARRDRRRSGSRPTCGSCAGSSANRSSATARHGPTPSSGSGHRTTGQRGRGSRTRPGRPPPRLLAGRSAGTGRRLPARTRRRRLALSAEDETGASRLTTGTATLADRDRGRRWASSMSTSPAAASPSGSRRRPTSIAPRSAAAAAHGSGPVELVAPMPGQVLSIRAPVGAAVEAGDTGRDPRGDEDGARGRRRRGPASSPTSTCRAGDQVSRGQRLAVVEPVSRDAVRCPPWRRRRATTDRQHPAAPADPRGAAALHRADARAPQRRHHGSPEHVAAIDLIGRIEVEIARIERAMDPPLV